MTVSYSLDVAKARFCGLAQLLGRWKGGIYKIIWREFLIFCLLYTILSVSYRSYLEEEQKLIFEKIVIYVGTFTDLIPLSFVLGFYVSLVIGRWWSQYETIPWPDRIAFSISSYVQGNDERSRLIRRTLARYVILTKVLTFQAVSTSVKRRFPTTGHLVAAGIMTEAEKRVYDKVSFSHGKWWLPLHWFTALATRARNEGRIKDSILLSSLLQEAYDFRTSCAIMFGYDWISVPLVYTQVVTIATYLYSLALVVGRQFLDPSKGYPNHDVDIYIPIFTLLQFFFYIGWLKVAEQILNPYGEDDDDFELNWCLDRAVHLSYLTVDHLRMKHPKMEKDYFWDEVEPILPQTKESALFGQPQLGSAFYLNVEEADYLPMDELLEKDDEENIYSRDSVKGMKENIRPSLLRRILSSGFGQSIKKKSSKSSSKSLKQRFSTKGIHNKAFDEASDDKNSKNNLTNHKSLTRETSLNNVIVTESPRNRTSSASFRPNTLTNHKHKVYQLRDTENREFSSTKNIEIERSCSSNGGSDPVIKSISAPAAVSFSNKPDGGGDDEKIDSCLESDEDMNEFMPSIPEEVPKLQSTDVGAKSLTNKIPLKRLDAVHNLVEDANRMLLELKCSMSTSSEGNVAGTLDEHFPPSENTSDDKTATETKLEKNEETASKTAVVIEMEKQQ